MKRRILTVFIAFCLMLTAMFCLASCRDSTLPPDGGEDISTPVDTTTENMTNDNATTAVFDYEIVGDVLFTPYKNGSCYRGEITVGAVCITEGVGQVTDDGLVPPGAWLVSPYNKKYSAVQAEVTDARQTLIKSGDRFEFSIRFENLPWGAFDYGVFDMIIGEYSSRKDKIIWGETIEDIVVKYGKLSDPIDVYAAPTIHTAEFDFEIAHIPQVQLISDTTVQIGVYVNTTCTSGKDYFSIGRYFFPARGWIIMPDGSMIASVSPNDRTYSTQVDIEEGDTFNSVIYFNVPIDDFVPGKYDMIISENYDVTGKGDFCRKTFNDVEIDYNIPVMPEKFGIGYKSDFIRVSSLDEDALSTLAVNKASGYPVCIIKSYDELVAYSELFWQPYDNGSATKLLEQYGNHDFAQSALVVTFITTGSGSIRFSHSHIDATEDGLVINIISHGTGLDGVYTADVAHWLSIIEMPHDRLVNVDHIDVRSVFCDGIYIEQDETDTTPAYLLILGNNRYMLDFGTDDGRRSYGMFRIENGETWDSICKLILRDVGSGETYVFSLYRDGRPLALSEEESTTPLYGLKGGDQFVQSYREMPRWTINEAQ